MSPIHISNTPTTSTPELYDLDKSALKGEIQDALKPIKTALHQSAGQQDLKQIPQSQDAMIQEALEYTQDGVFELKDASITADKFVRLINLINTQPGITEFRIINCQFESIPAEIGNLNNLTSLTISDNGELTTLPAEIGNLTNLTSLTISANGELTTLPGGIGNLTNLTELNLRLNWLTTLPAEIGNLTNLTSLNLENNRLTTLPPQIKDLTNLTSLNLEGNRLTTLPAEIGNLTNLTSLNLKGNRLTTLPAEIGDLTNLTELSLEGNSTLDISNTSFPASLKTIYVPKERKDAKSLNYEKIEAMKKSGITIQYSQ